MFDMDNFEKLIAGSKEDIQNDIPAEGHFERFELKLDKKLKFKPNYWLGVVSGIAAVLLIALIAFFYQGKQEKQIFTLSDISQNYADVEFYYTSSINQQTKKLSDLCEKYGKDDRTLDLLMKELHEYDHTYDQICADLKVVPGDERVINALITYYKTKLDIINKILEEIESKRIKNESNENSII